MHPPIKMLLKIYKKLLKYFGKQDWWPAETRFEVIVGAILTQNTNWKNVEKAIINLKKAGVLSLSKLSKVLKRKICEYIRPSGFFNQKAERLILLMDFLKKNYRGSISVLMKENLKTLRRKLLGLKGVGPETADSILLYAADKPSFVIDAYTKRIFSRLGISANDKYEDLQYLFQKDLPKSVSLYKEYHALIVELAKKHCRKKPLCSGCPLSDICNHKN